MFHAGLWVVFVIWAFLLLRDYRRGYNGLTLALLVLLLSYNIFSESWSLFTVTLQNWGLREQTFYRHLVLDFRMVHLVTAFIVSIWFMKRNVDETNNAASGGQVPEGTPNQTGQENQGNGQPKPHKPG